MKVFRQYMWFEWKRFFSKRNMIVFGVVLLLALVFTQYAVVVYKKGLEDTKRFQESEKEKIKHILNYRVYGLQGFRVKMQPAPESIFFSNSAPFQEVASLVDTSESVKIYNILQSYNVFKVRLKWFTDFSGVILIFGSFLAFLFGFESYLFIGYLKLLSSVAGRRRVFLNIALSRAIILTLFFLAALVLAYLLIVVNGIDIPLTWSLPVFLVTIVSTILCFFALGAFLGLLKTKWIGLVVGILVWFLSIFAAPVVIELVTAGSADSLASVYEMEINKMKILDDFQKRIIKKHGVLALGESPTEERILDLRSYEDNEFKEILKYDVAMIERMDRTARLHRWLSVIFPTTNYWAVNYEISSSGYKSVLDFYRIIKATKVDFLKVVFENSYFSGKFIPKVDPFLKGDGNVFKPDSWIPGTVPWGVAIAFIYMGFFLAVTHRKYQRNLFSLTVNELSERFEEDLFLEYGEIAAFAIHDHRFLDHLFCLMSNHGVELKNKGYEYAASLEGKDLVSLTEPLNFIYLVSKDKMPRDIKTGHFLSFVMRLANSGKEQRERLLTEPGLSGMLKKPLHKLNNDEYGTVLTAIMNTGIFKIIVLADAFKYVSNRVAVKLKKVMDRLTIEKETLVVHAILQGTFFKHSGDTQLFSQQETLNSMLDKIKISPEEAG